VAKRRNLVDAKTASDALTSMVQLISSGNIALVPTIALISDAFAVAEESSNRALYDALYVSLAKRENGPLASKDAKQVALAKKIGIKTEDI
jgi:predicted nucleic acid-binding protein